MEALHVQVPPSDRAGRLALTALDCALAASRSGESIEPLVRVDAEAFRDLPMAEVRPRLDALLCARHADVGLEVLLQIGFINAVLPELAKVVGFGDGESHKDVWRHTKQVVIQCLPRLPVRWAALFHDIGKPRTRSVAPDGTVHFFHHAEEGARMFERLDRRLGLFAVDPELGADIRFLVLHHQRAHQYEEDWTDSAVRRFARDVGGALDDLMALSRADMTTKRREKRRRFLFQLKDLQERIAALAAEDAKEPPLPKGLGDELMQAFGLPPSRLIGDLRRSLEAAVEAGELPPGQSAEVYIEFVRGQRARFGLPD
ncbi:MAG TPA: HDIG domain-containing protein [Polyangiaceae bacterium]|nr:HDIG domain-containing protein [Polyangiaceae bacterium]